VKRYYLYFYKTDTVKSPKVQAHGDHWWHFIQATVHKDLEKASSAIP
jgi:hypothetical protein